MVRCRVELVEWLFKESWGEEKTYADDALRSDQLDQLVGVASLSVALAVGLKVTQVADVALLVFGSTVGLVVGVDCLFVSVLFENISFPI
jgi:hypothetical protein